MINYLSFLGLMVLHMNMMGQDTTFIMVISGENAEEAVSIFNTSDGEAQIVANTGSYGRGGSDIYFANIGADASIKKSWIWGESEQDKAIQAVYMDSVIYVLGIRNTFDNPDYRYFMVSHDMDGNELWYRELNLKFGEDEAIIINGESEIYQFNRLGKDVLQLQKISKEGVVLFEQQITVDKEFLIGDCLLRDSLIYCALEVGIEGKETDIMIIRTDISFQASVDVTIDYFEIDQPVGIDVDSVGNIYVAANVRDSIDGNQDVTLFKLSKNLEMKDTGEYTGPLYEQINNAIIGDNGEFVFVGYTESFGFGGDFLVGRYDTNLNFILAPTLGSTRVDRGKDIEYIPSYGYWLFGETYGFGASGSDLLIYKINVNGITESNEFVLLFDSLQRTLDVPELPIEEPCIIIQNPINRNSRIECFEDIIEFSLFDFQGHMIDNSSFEKPISVIDLGVFEGLKPGLYFALVTSIQGRTVRKLLVE